MCTIAMSTLVLTVVLALVGCDAAPGAAEPTTVKRGGDTYLYEVTGEGTATLTYSNDDEDTPQTINVTLPWSQEVTINGATSAVELFAQNGAEVAGALTCRISQNGKVLARAASSGAAAIVRCKTGRSR